MAHSREVVTGISATFVDGGGGATVNSSRAATNVFEFVNSSAAGTELVMGLSSIIQVDIRFWGMPRPVSVAWPRGIIPGGGKVDSSPDTSWPSPDQVGGGP